MKSEHILQGVIAVIIALSVPVSSRKSGVEACDGGEVIATSSIAKEDAVISVATQTCPGILSTRRSNRLSKRQYTLPCTSSCSMDCLNLGPYPNMSDCEFIASTLFNQTDSALFLAPSQTKTTFSYSTCAMVFYNYDSIDYEVCYHMVGNAAIFVDNTCFAGPSGSNGGYCIAAPFEAYNQWQLEVYAP
ncbi:predicted protein [Sparassis crispa]|uniref:Apple domain-containing protein n=1 Tax=Sparassis crispa TaxID=139825 RepID=A0A401H291_9APHY|nr:predicted protein [Sparassis crispa]GBE88534.1 predicted protein [Sparassis crispa]